MKKKILTILFYFLIIVGLLILLVFLPTFIQCLYSIGKNWERPLSNQFYSNDILVYVTSFLGSLATIFIGIMTYRLQRRLNDIEKNRDLYAYSSRLTCLSSTLHHADITYRLRYSDILDNKIVLYNDCKGIAVDEYLSFTITLNAFQISEIAPEEIRIDSLKLNFDDKYNFSFSNHVKDFRPLISSERDKELYIVLYLLFLPEEELRKNIYYANIMSISFPFTLKAFNRFEANYQWEQKFISPPPNEDRTDYGFSRKLKSREVTIQRRWPYLCFTNDKL